MMRFKDGSGKWTRASKIVGTLSGIAVLLSMAGSGVFRFADANAWDTEVAEVEQEIVKTLQQFREEQKRDDCRDIVRDLNLLRSKERTEGLSEYDEIYRDQLIAEKEESCS